ncbi:MAG: tRNA threonylcarbamoyladenosine dehydratase [Firmicutes bacterium]|nr:tRNA threonylcarbamoyladenosine dehydratase [candidate division NPL-UPA2 bacterium]
MPLNKFSRTELLVGEAGLRLLGAAHVAIIGIGGVGSYTTEALARAGVGKLTLVDYDDICLTNVNRQLHALQSTLGQAKVEVMSARVKEINPSIEVVVHKSFMTAELARSVLTREVSYVVDAVDTVTAKLAIIMHCKEQGIPVVSCLGAGNKLDPTRFMVVDISKTSICPLARIVRKELGKRGVKSGVKVVYSEEVPMVPEASASDCARDCICPGRDANCRHKRHIPGSISFVPAVAGLIAAGVVVNDLLGLKQT